MIYNTAVRWFSNNAQGAPTVYGDTAGGITNMLDYCLINGSGTTQLTSLVVANGIATATAAAFKGYSGQVVLIAGATPSGLNGYKKVISTNDTTTFTFNVSGISDQTATGTIVASLAPIAGWSILYTATNKRVYRRTTQGATAMLLRVDDTLSRCAQLTMYETMSDVNTGTNGVSYYLNRSAYGNNTKAWFIVGDPFCFYWAFNGNDYGDNYGVFGMFGDIISYKANDAYHCFIDGSGTSGGSFSGTIKLQCFNGSASNTVSDGGLCRSYTQMGTAVGTRRYSHGNTSAFGSCSPAETYPSPADNSYHAWPIEVVEWSTAPDGTGGSPVCMRGRLPGIYAPMHTANSVQWLSMPAYCENGLLLRTCAVGNNTAAGWDLVGPWR